METLNKDLEELEGTTTAVLEEENAEESTLEEESALPEEENSEEEVISEVVIDTTTIVSELQVQNGLLQQCNDTLAIILIVVLFMLFRTYVTHTWEHIRSIGK